MQPQRHHQYRPPTNPPGPPSSGGYHDPSPRRKKHQITFAQNSFYGNANENEDDANKDAREQAKKAQGDVEFLFSQLQKVQHERDELLERNSSLSAQLSGANAHAKELLNKKKSEEESFRRILQKEKDAFERHKVKVQDSKEEKIELLFDWALSCLENQWDLSGDKDVAHLLLRTAVSDARLRQLMLHMRTPEQLAESGAGEAAAAVIEKHNKKSEKQQQQRTTSPRRGRTKKRKIHSAGNNNRKSSVSKGRHSDTEDESGGGGGGKRDTHSRSRSRPRANASGDDADDGDRPEVSDSDDEVARGYALIQKISKVVRDIDRATGEGGGGEEGHDDDEGERQGGAGGVERSLAATTGGHGISTNEKKTTKVGNKTTTTKKLKKLKKKRKGAKKGGSKLSSTTGGAATTDDDNDEDDDDDGVNGDDNEDGGGQGCAQPKHGNAQHQQPLHKQYKNSNSSNNNILNNNNNNNIINDGISMNSEAKQPTGTKLSSSAAPAVKVTAGSVVVAGGGGGDDDSILAMADMLNEEGGDGSFHKQQQQNSNILQHDSVLSDASKILAGSAAGADGANHGTAATATTSSGGGVDDDRTLPFSGDDEMEMKYLSKLLAETRGMAINASQDIGLFQTAIDPNDIYDKTGQAPYSPIRNASVPPVQPIHSATDSETPLSSTYNDLLHQSATGHNSADKNYSDKTISTNTNNNKFGRCGSGTGSDSVVSIPPVIPVDLMMMGDRNAMELEISLQETSVTDEDQRVRSRASSPNGRQIVSGSGSRQQQSYNAQDPFGSTDFTRRNDIKYEYFDDTYLSHETKNIVSGHSKYDDILASGEIEKANTKTSTAAISTSNSSSSAYLGSDTEERQKPNESAYDRYKRELAEAEQLRKKQEAKTALYGDYKQPPNSSSSGVAPVASTDGNSSSSSSSGRNNSSAVPVAAAKGVSVDELVRDILTKVDYMDRSMASSGDAAAKSSRERTTSNDSFDYGQIGALNTAGSTGSAGNNSNSGTTTRVPSTPSTHQNQQYPQNQRQLLPVESTPYTNAGNYGGGAASYTPTINKGNTDISGDNYYSSSHPSSSMLTAAAQSDTALPVTAANTHQSNAAAATTTAVVASASTESSQVYTPFTGTSAPNSVTAAGTKKSVTGTPRGGGGGGGGTGGDVSAGKSEGGDDYEADFEYSADFEAGSVVTTGSKNKSSTIKSTTAIADTVAAPPVPAAAAAPVPAPVPTSAAAVARVNVPSASASIRSDGLLPGGDLDDDLYNPDFD